MNIFDNRQISEQSFAFRDLSGQDRWLEWTPVFTGLTVVGATTYSARFRIVGKSCEFQVKLSAATSIASVAGTTYLALPIASVGLSGIAAMTDQSSNIAVGSCHVDVTNSRCYLPTQTASANTFNLCGSMEI